MGRDPLSYEHPITGEDLSRALVAIAADDGGCWRGAPVALADRLIHRFDIGHQPITVADLAEILLFLRSLLALADARRFVALGGAAGVSIETQEIHGRRTDIIVLTMGAADEEAAP